MPLDYHLAPSLVRVKAATAPGVFEDDPDVSSPGVPLPDPLVADTPELTFAWRVPNRTCTKVKIKVTFRRGGGNEIAGTFNAYFFGVVPLHAAEVAFGAVRPAIEKLDAFVGISSATPMILGEIALYDTFGVCLSGIVAAAAERAFIRCEEVD